MGHGRLVHLTAAAVVCVFGAGCSRKVLEVLVDLPPTAPPPAPTTFTPLDPSLLNLPPVYLMAADTVVPEIEKTLNPDSVVAMLPRDNAGNIDWMEALRQEIIRPRDGIDGPRTPPPGNFEFEFDFYFPGPAEMFDAYFPHSAHTEWMECAQCHPRIFRTRPVQIQMADVFAGKYCGECHGKVAYPVMTGCENCHTGLAQPPDRAQPELIGTIEMRRASEIIAERDSIAAAAAGTPPEPDSVASDSTTAQTRSGPRVTFDGLPKARFPHWVHRIRFRCKTCHMDIFEPKAGTNAVTMADIEAGEACGNCHNGDVAFEPRIENCERCHVPPLVASGSSGEGEGEAP